MAAGGRKWRFGDYLPSSLSFVVLFILAISQIVFQVLSVTITTESKIIAKVKTVSGCIDNNGVNRSHSDSWSSAAGQCDKNICYFSQSVGIWIIEERCRQIDTWENPDKINCKQVSNTGATFPACCAVLQCNSSNPLTTFPPNYCYDRGSEFSCFFWRNVTDGCLPAGLYYNFTQIYCKKTCGLC